MVKYENFVIIDHIKYWHPEPGKPINIREVDDYILRLRKMFYLIIK